VQAADELDHLSFHGETDSRQHEDGKDRQHR
jgi:hypothetical protein